MEISYYTGYTNYTFQISGKYPHYYLNNWKSAKAKAKLKKNDFLYVLYYFIVNSNDISMVDEKLIQITCPCSRT